MVSPIESVEQLAGQKEIRYGAVEGGSTQEFFKVIHLDKKLGRILKCQLFYRIAKTIHTDVCGLLCLNGVRVYLLNLLPREFRKLGKAKFLFSNHRQSV